MGNMLVVMTADLMVVMTVGKLAGLKALTLVV